METNNEVDGGSPGIEPDKLAGKTEMTEKAEIVPSFAVSMERIKERISQLQQFIRSYMVKDEDYGIIPGTPKPTLLKPGAEKLCDVYGFSKRFEVTNRVEDWQNGFFHYEVKALLTNKRTGFLEAEGLGSCNSREKRYSDRWVTERKLPEGTSRDTLVRREREGRYGTYYEYLVKNDDTYTLVNTVLKMAKKRALVDAVLSATRTSGMFTQDLEDMMEYGAEKRNDGLH